MLADREFVRIGLQRSTIHVVTADDAVWMRPLHDAVLRKPLSGFIRNLRDLDLDAVADAARALLEPEPLTWAAFGRRLQERSPDRDGASLAQIGRARLALVQVPPRGVWRASGPAAHTTLEAWLGRPLDPAPSVERLFLRYLAAYGPASAMDAQAWCGITRLAAVVDGLRPQLQTFRGEDERELFDLPDAPRPDPETPAPVRFAGDSGCGPRRRRRPRLVGTGAGRRRRGARGPGVAAVGGRGGGGHRRERRAAGVSGAGGERAGRARDRRRLSGGRFRGIGLWWRWRDGTCWGASGANCGH